MKPFEGIVPFFEQISTKYPGTAFANCDTQVKLDEALIEHINGSSTNYVTKTVFDATKAMVDVAIEDWPSAVGSVWNVCQDLYHLITNTSLQANIAMQQQAQAVSLAQRISAIESFLSSQGYVPPN